MPSPIHPAQPGAEWWRSAVIYQVYPRSFKDSNADGIGDLPGITDKLPELAALGVDAVWLSPFYRSPQRDGGYDVADYCDVDPLFGTLADFDLLLARAHQLGLRVLIDLVPNHSSSDHAWFQRALSAAPGSPERAWYHFAEGKGPNGELPPNNWLSLFGGPAWTRTTNADDTPGQWYLHLFDSTQPDLNWENPAVRDAFDEILRFWLDRGVDGFRVDVAHAMAKAPGLPDHPNLAAAGAGYIEGKAAPPMWLQPQVHDILRRWRTLLNSYPGERIMCGEAYVLPLSLMADWVRPDEFQQTFNFRFVNSSWDAATIRATINESFAAFDSVGAPSTWVLNNHDVVRSVSRFGGLTMRATDSDGVGPEDPQPDNELGLRRARGAAAFMLGLPGSAYLYQGEELGLAEHTTLEPEFRQDPTFARTKGARKGRDGCRIPLPWEAGIGESNGFSAASSAWLPQPESYRLASRNAQVGLPESTLELYRSALKLRRELALGEGSFEWVAEYCSDSQLAYRNGATLVIHNFGHQATALPAGRVVLSSLHHIGAPMAHLAPDQTVWIEQ